jgi:hypothetical protein
MLAELSCYTRYGPLGKRLYKQLAEIKQLDCKHGTHSVAALPTRPRDMGNVLRRRKENAAIALTNIAAQTSGEILRAAL